MTTHLSARLSWHDSGWDGKICEKPTQNAYCIAHEHIRESRNDEFEDKNSRQRLKNISENKLPPCARDVGAFSSTPTHILHEDPLENRAHPPIFEEIPPYSFCTVPFEVMFSEEEGRTWVSPKEQEEQKKRLNNFFGELDKKGSLVFFM